MSTITKDQAKDLRNAFHCWQQDYDPVEDKEQYDMFGLGMVAMDALLASLEAEAVAWRYRTTDINGNPNPDWSFSEEASLLGLYQPLYAAPPAPVSVTDERYQHVSELYHAQEKRLFKLAQRIKGPSFDKYAHSPSQAIDVLESALFGEHDDDCRAAMLQGAEQQNQQQNIPENIPATQFKPVSDLYEVTVPSGRSTTFTKDAAEASDCRVMGWFVQEYVKLERYQYAMLQGKESENV